VGEGGRDAKHRGRKFGWLSDRFGVSWQLNWPND
jgi:predicted 3-demethylubiquinone-9 3-methyltransferase (glyoxalase superfamily)